MFDFNFLSKQERTSYRRWVWMQHTAIGLFLVALLLIAVSAVMVVGRYSTESLASATAQETESLTAAQNSLSSSTSTETQRTLQQLNTIQNDHYLYLDHLSRIYATAVPNVAFTSIDLDYSLAELTLTGTADSREDFITFQEQLDTLEGFTLSSVPLDLLSQPTDIHFQITLVIDEAE